MTMEHKKSENVILLERGDDFVVYNSLVAGSLLEIDENVVDLVNSFIIPRTVSQTENASDGGIKPVIDILIQNKILVPNDFDERDALEERRKQHVEELKMGKKLHGLILEVTKRCNFRCEYCFAHYLSKEHGRNLNSQMNKQVAFRSISFLFENARKNNITSVEIGFMGGEPLLNWRLVMECIYCANKMSEDSGIRVLYSLTTNGSLITESIADELSKQKINTSISLDGLPEENDVSRVYANGRGTFDDVVKGVGILTGCGVYPTILTTLTDKNIRIIGEEFIELLRKMKIKDWGVNLEDVGGMLNVDISEVAQRVIYLCTLANEKGISAAGMWFKPVFSAVKERIAYCNGASGSFISVEPDGKIYSCSRTSKPIGHVDEIESLLNSAGYLAFGSNIVGSKSSCHGCEVEGLCLGGCPAIDNPVSSESQACSSIGCNKAPCDFIRTITRAILSNTGIPLLE
jgi:uncharacterized protein